MSCYNRTHTRYKEIERYFNLSPLVIDMILDDYHTKTGASTDSYPSVELLIKLNEGQKSMLMSKDAAQEERRKYKNHPALSVEITPVDNKYNVTYSPKIVLPIMPGVFSHPPL